MKKMMIVMVAALSFAAVGQEADGQKGPKEGLRRGPRSTMIGERGMLPGGMTPGMMTRGMGGEMMSDPAVMAVMNPKVAEKIGLSNEVREQIKKLDTDNREKVKELQAKTRAAMEKQAKLMKEEKIDEAGVMSAIDELFDCRKEMAKAQTKRVITIKSLLTPDQLKQAMEEMKSLREERRVKRGPKPEAKDSPKPECKDCPKPECDKPVPPPAK